MRIGGEWSAYSRYCKSLNAVIADTSPYLPRTWTGRSKEAIKVPFTRRYLRLRYRAICYNSRPFWPVHSIDYCVVALFIFSLQQLDRSRLSSLFSSLFLAPTSSLINICQYREISEEEIDFLSLHEISLSLSLSPPPLFASSISARNLYVIENYQTLFICALKRIKEDSRRHELCYALLLHILSLHLILQGHRNLNGNKNIQIKQICERILDAFTNIR